MLYKSRYLQEINSLFKLQFRIGLVIAIVLAIYTMNIHVIISSLLGTALVIAPSFAYLAIIAKKKWVAHPEEVLYRHKRGIITKFLLNIIIFSFIFVLYKNCNLLVLFFTYFIVLSSYWFVLILGFNKYGFHN